MYHTDDYAVMNGLIVTCFTLSLAIETACLTSDYCNDTSTRYYNAANGLSIAFAALGVILPWLFLLFSCCRRGVDGARTSGRHASGLFTGLALALVSLYATVMAGAYLVEATPEQNETAGHVVAALALCAAICGLLGLLTCPCRAEPSLPYVEKPTVVVAHTGPGGVGIVHTAPAYRGPWDIHHPSTLAGMFGYIVMCFSIAQGIVTGCNAVGLQGNTFVPVNDQCDPTASGAIAIFFALAGVFIFIIGMIFSAPARPDGYSAFTTSSAIIVMTALTCVSLSELITESCHQSLLHGGCHAWSYWGGSTFVWALAATLGLVAGLVNQCTPKSIYVA